jgi:hypothetical protein
VAHTPDSRFRIAFTPEVSGMAMAAMDEVLRTCGDAGQQLAAGVPPKLEHSLLFNLSLAIQDELGAVAFAVYGAALERAGFPRATYDGHKQPISRIVKKIEAFAGDRLKTRFVTPQNVAEDLEFIMLEFRRERFVVRPDPDPAVFIDASSPEVGSPKEFVLDNGKVRYLQLVAMPLAKARILYAATYGEALLAHWPRAVVTAVRRRWVDPGAEPRIEFYLLGRNELTTVLRDLPGVEVLPILSAAAIEDDAWRSEWLTPGKGPISRVAVLMDTDPFDMLQRQSEGTIRTAVIRVRRSSAEPDHAEIFCMTEDSQPGVLHFTPCTTPFRQALLEFAKARCHRWLDDPAIIAEWQDVLERVAGHILREERVFGVEFWL